MMINSVLSFVITILVFENITACYTPNSNSVEQINPSNIQFKEISAASDGTVYALTTEDVNHQTILYRYDSQSSQFMSIPVSQYYYFRKISVGSSSLVYGITKYGHALKLKDDKISFSFVEFSATSALKDISVGADGALWVIDTGDRIYKKDGSSWTRVSGSLVQIDVIGSPSEWIAMGVNIHGSVYGRTSSQSSWTQLQGTLTEVSHVESSTGWSVYGINIHNWIYQLDYASWMSRVSSSNSWWGICGYAISIAALSKDLYYIVGADHNVYKITDTGGCNWSFHHLYIGVGAGGFDSKHTYDGRWSCENIIPKCSGFSCAGGPDYVPKCSDSSPCPNGWSGSSCVNYCQTDCASGGCPYGWKEEDSVYCGLYDVTKPYNTELCTKPNSGYSAHSEISNVLNEIGGFNAHTNDSYYRKVIELNINYIITSIIVSLLVISICLCIYQSNCCKIGSKSNGFAVISSVGDDCEEVHLKEEINQIYDEENKM